MCSPLGQRLAANPLVHAAATLVPLTGRGLVGRAGPEMGSTSSETTESNKTAADGATGVENEQQHGSALEKSRAKQATINSIADRGRSQECRWNKKHPGALVDGLSIRPTRARGACSSQFFRGLLILARLSSPICAAGWRFRSAFFQLARQPLVGLLLHFQQLVTRLICASSKPTGSRGTRLAGAEPSAPPARSR